MTKILLDAGWTPNRDDVSLADSYALLWGSSWNDKAAAFVRSFGGIEIYGKLWIWAEPFCDHDLVGLKPKIETAIGSPAVPVATSSYIGDGCLIWIDKSERFYAVDSEGMVFVGEGAATAFEVLLFGVTRPPPPVEIRKALELAHEWK